MNNLLIKIKQFFSESEAIISDDCQEIYFRKKAIIIIFNPLNKL
jgi:hypothetical protein